MERQLAHMVRLIDDLLDISRINSGKIRLELARMHAARRCCDSAVRPAGPAIDARAATRCTVDLPRRATSSCMGDATRLAQAFGNLLNNAAKYTPAGRPHRAARRGSEGGEAVVEVSDNGVGIPRRDAGAACSSCSRRCGGTLDRAQGGLGIGLSLVRSLVELHGGTRARPRSAGAGQGSTFTVRLPCLRGRRRGRDRAGRRRRRRRRRRRCRCWWWTTTSTRPRRWRPCWR